MLDLNAPVTLTLDTYEVCSIAHSCFMQAHEAIDRGHLNTATAEAAMALRLFLAADDAKGVATCNSLFDIIERRKIRQAAEAAA